MAPPKVGMVQAPFLVIVRNKGKKTAKHAPRMDIAILFGK